MTDKKIFGVVCEFDHPEQLVEAAHMVKAYGFRKTDALIPFPVHGLDEALGIPRSRLGWVCLAAGAVGTLTAYLLIWFTGQYVYPLVIGGKPLFAVTPSIPIMFELTVLFAAFAAVIGMIAVNGLPRFYHPVMNYSRFKKFSDDRFLLVIESSDPMFHTQESPRFLASLGAKNIELVEE